MFKLTIRGDYALLLLASLAEAENDDYLSLKDIAKEKNLPLPFLAQIAATLRSAGLVLSKEGRDGGYRLAKSPERISLLEALEVIEGPLAPVRCCESKGTCGAESQCGVKPVWQQATNTLAAFLQSKTLADIVHSS